MEHSAPYLFSSEFKGEASDKISQLLIDRLKSGDPSAQEALYKKMAFRMYLLCLKYVKNSAIAKDLVHDGFIRIFSKINSFRGDSSLETWITRLMVNLSISHLRKIKREGVKVDVDEFYLHSSIASEKMDQLPSWSLQKVLKLFPEMPTGYRQVIQLFVFEMLPHSEIAKMLGISEGTSKSQLSKARSWILQRVSQNPIYYSENL